MEVIGVITLNMIIQSAGVGSLPHSAVQVEAEIKRKRKVNCRDLEGELL